MISMVSMFKENRSETRIANRSRHVIDGRKRNQRGNMPCNTSTCKNKQQMHERL